ncbi:protein takeout [Halyomorpha halys]|uniref:protein takeout n=1 Tax=Halyomorpha halys TaxID=286706 RepID=UPI0006D4F48D|nr:protein takeout-like [Halyomorpha halys]
MFRLLILLCACATAFGALPKGWKACSKSDSKYSECLSKEMFNAVKSLEHGNKKLGVLPLDPLRITKMQISKGNGPVAIELLLTDLDIHGITDSKIKNVKNDWKTMEIEILIPRLEILSNYKIDGKVLVLPIVGHGKANMTYDQLSIKAICNWKEVEKDNTKYINMESLTIPFEAKRLYMDFENLFNGDEALAKNMNNFLNENWDAILNELRKPISEGLSVVLINFSNQILNKIPFSDINK